MTKVFYFVGCSTTACDNLTDDVRNKVGWPWLVSAHHSATVINDGISGGSNDSVISNLLQNVNKRYDRYYVQWTFPQRFSLTDAHTWEVVNFSKNLYHTTYQKKDYYTVFGKYYYTRWASPVILFEKMLEKIVLAQSLLSAHNLSYNMMNVEKIYWNKFVETDLSSFTSNVTSSEFSSNIPDHLIADCYNRIQTLVNQIDFTKFISPQIFNFSDNFLHCSPDKSLHPDKEGNEYLADRILALENF